MPATRHLLFIPCSLGLEALLEEEVAPWGSAPGRRVGGVELRVDREGLWRVCLLSRLAEGVRLRLKPFVAADFASLQKELRKLPFRAFLPAGARVQIKVSCHESRLWHSGAVRERVAAVLQEHVGWVVEEHAWVVEPRDGGLHDAGAEPVRGDQSSVESEREHAVSRPPGSSQSSPFVHTLFVRLEKDEVQVSLDAGGPRLHQRGERTRVERASLRETLAAALVRLARQRVASEGAAAGGAAAGGAAAGGTAAGGAAAGRPGGELLEPSELPLLWDPFCGAGTIPLEWCGAALGRVAGRERRLALEEFRDFDAEAFAGFRERLVSREASAGSGRLLAIASDSSERAVAATRANAQGAGYGSQLQVLRGDVRKVAAEVPAGACVVTNPPYGRRLQEAGAVRALLSVLAERPDLRPVVVLVGGAAQKVVPAAHPALVRFKNGGLNVSARLVRG